MDAYQEFCHLRAGGVALREAWFRSREGIEDLPEMPIGTALDWERRRLKRLGAYHPDLVQLTL